MHGTVRITRIPRREFIADVAKMDEPFPGAPRSEQLPLELLSNTVETSVVTPPSAAVPDCQECGVCCFVPGLIGVTEDETGPLGEIVEVTLDITADVVIERFIRKDPVTRRCIHLDGDLGNGVKCSVYNERPAVCREFEAGSDKCHEYRRMCGLEPPLKSGEFTLAMAALRRVRGKADEIVETRILEDYGLFKRVLWVLGFKFSKRPSLKVVAFLSDGSEQVIHRYSPNSETWYESDFWGMTIDAARAMINEKKTSAK